jgi:hypothetical protein
MVRWPMVTDAEGSGGTHCNCRTRPARARMVAAPLRAELRDAVLKLHAHWQSRAKDYLIHSERDAGMSAVAVQVWFYRLYPQLGFSSASSHSGRRTFITRIAKKIVEASGSLRDVQAGRTCFAVDNERYNQDASAAKRRVVDM